MIHFFFLKSKMVVVARSTGSVLGGKLANWATFIRGPSYKRHTHTHTRWGRVSLLNKQKEKKEEKKENKKITNVWWWSHVTARREAPKRCRLSFCPFIKTRPVPPALPPPPFHLPPMHNTPPSLRIDTIVFFFFFLSWKKKKPKRKRFNEELYT